MNSAKTSVLARFDLEKQAYEERPYRILIVIHPCYVFSIFFLTSFTRLFVVLSGIVGGLIYCAVFSVLSD